MIKYYHWHNISGMKLLQYFSGIIGRLVEYQSDGRSLEYSQKYRWMTFPLITGNTHLAPITLYDHIHCPDRWCQKSQAEADRICIHVESEVRYPL